MKGIVFTEFLEMVEDTLGPATADDLIESCDLPSGGVYTALGTYDHAEIVQLVVRLSAMTQTPVGELLKAFGKHLLGRFVALYPAFFTHCPTLFDLLSNVETYIHVEVRKLYPDAELPHFHCIRPTSESLHMVYSSQRPFADLAEGLIQGCIEHYGKSFDLRRCDLDGPPGTHARFELIEAK